ncbi:uncharacterized protein MONOS_12647 [Monocercomonoides exilis]|uniref:uncharacterized protein n=1 Tax=Monocercomonoides exilis TaxID=2049356 RepID=UPI00355A586C|nr:hypothetical protein MONOS_12647 [Monocercomonoides exilis]|eukprot:MONOS_12647.1-p1 / transcript=MONOS_12647.1 / gene=MONOS_12647 / organism=Monocercomonoides_exilis_PA203 / gene_product=unspecified product / transcript_product=unspecified product / location=Mono_scaffold00714:14683-15432(+) / protein_length=250 / sequence_SO=supercontig / SO=protein_coding / is_pseudo=false
MDGDGQTPSVFSDSLTATHSPMQRSASRPFPLSPYAGGGVDDGTSYSVAGSMAGRSRKDSSDSLQKKLMRRMMAFAPFADRADTPASAAPSPAHPSPTAPTPVRPSALTPYGMRYPSLSPSPLSRTPSSSSVLMSLGPSAMYQGSLPSPSIAFTRMLSPSLAAEYSSHFLHSSMDELSSFVADRESTAFGHRSSSPSSVTSVASAASVSSASAQRNSRTKGSKRGSRKKALSEMRERAKNQHNFQSRIN